MFKKNQHSMLILLFMFFVSRFIHCLAQTTTCDASNLCKSTTVTNNQVNCEGNQVCELSDITATGSHALCRGYYSCEGSSSNPSVLTAYDDIRCESWYSCYYGEFHVYSSNSGSPTVVCRGYRSCYYGDITDSDFTDIYCYGQQACRNATIGNMPDLFCYSYYSCFYAEISNLERVYCGGYYSCWGARISDITTTTLRCAGWYSCRKAKISNAPYLRVGGERGLYQATVNGVKSIVLLGYYALQYGTIINDGLTNMTVSLYGYWAGKDGTIICNKDSNDDLCTIYCYGNTACVNLTVNCFATCNIYCDESAGIACPIGYNGPTHLPTEIPTYFPTDEPSEDPTMSPSFNPSVLPSMLPTGIPSVAPTFLPSVEPSSEPSSEPSGQPTGSPVTATTGIISTTSGGGVITTETATTTGIAMSTTEDGGGAAEQVTGGEGSSDAVTCITENMGLLILFVLLLVFLLMSLCLNVVLVTKNRATHVVARQLLSYGGNSPPPAGAIGTGKVNIDLMPIHSNNNKTGSAHIGMERMMSTSMNFSTNASTDAMLLNSSDGGVSVNSNNRELSPIATMTNSHGSHAAAAQGIEDIDMQLAIAIAKKLQAETSKYQNNGENNNRNGRNGGQSVEEMANAAGAAVAAIGVASAALSQPVPQRRDPVEAMYNQGVGDNITIDDHDAEFDEGGRVQNSTR